MSEVFNSEVDARLALVRRALTAKPNSAELLFKLADALWDHGEPDEFAAVFQRAYRLRPQARLKLGEWTAATKMQKARQLRDKAQALTDRGVNYSPVLAALAISNAILGDRAEVERLVDYEHFFQCREAVVPEKFAGDDFYASFAAEVKAGLRFYDTPDDRAIRKAWRNEDIFRSQAPACRAFAAEVYRQVEQYISQLPRSGDHPFLASRPQHYVIDGWAVVSGAAGYHAAHIHPYAWMSGVYYVVRPEISRGPRGAAGWLRVGPPPEVGLAPDCGWQEHLVEPEPGNIVLMPGYFIHDTQPLGIDQERICIAFDVIPKELLVARREHAAD
jgi:hypothetical protein